MGGVGGFAPDVATIARGRVVAGQVARQRYVFRCRTGVVHRHRHIVDGCHIQRHRGSAGVSILVSDGVREAVRAVVVGVWHVSERAVGVHHHRAMLWIGGLGPDIAAVGAGRVVANQCGGERGVFIQSEHVVDCHRHRIAIDGDGDGRVGGIPIFVGDGVVERFGQRLAVDQRCNRRIAIVKRIAVGAVRIERDVAIGACTGCAHRATRNTRHRACDRGTIRADDIVGEGIARNGGRAFGDAVRVRVCGGHVVDDLDDKIAETRLCTGTVVRHD